MAIDAAVAAYLRPSLPKSGLAFEPRAKSNSKEWVNARSASRVAAMGAALGASPVYHDSIYVCGRTPWSCNLLRNTAVLLAFSEPIVTGDKATVHVERLTKTSYERIPVARQRSDLNLVRTRTGWQVIGIGAVSES
ncbi:MAG: hypothetical protein ABJE47_19700 [bacterium]